MDLENDKTMTTGGGAKSTSASTVPPHNPRPKSATHRVPAQHVAGRLSEAGTASPHGLAVTSSGHSPVAGSSSRASRSPVRSGRGHTSHALSFPRRAQSAGRDSRQHLIGGAEGGTFNNSFTVAGNNNSGTSRTNASDVKVNHKSGSNSNKHAVAVHSGSQRRNVQDNHHHHSQSSPNGIRTNKRKSGTDGKSAQHSSSSPKTVDRLKVTTSSGKVRPVQVVRPLQRVQNTEGKAGSASSSEASSSASSASVPSSSSSQRTGVSAGSRQPPTPGGEAAGSHRMGNPVSRELLVASGALEENRPSSGSVYRNVMTTASLPPSSSLSSHVGSLNAYKKGKTLPSSNSSGGSSERRHSNGASHQEDYTARGTSGINPSSSVTGEQPPSNKPSHPFTVNPSFTARDRDCTIIPGYVGDIVRELQNSGERTLSDSDNGHSKASDHSRESERSQNAVVSNTESAGSSRNSEQINSDETKELTVCVQQPNSSHNNEGNVPGTNTSLFPSSDSAQQSRVAEGHNKHPRSAGQGQLKSTSQSQQSESIVPSREQTTRNNETQRQSAFVPVVSRNTTSGSSSNRTESIAASSRSQSEPKDQRQNNGATNKEAFSNTRTTSEQTINQNSSSRPETTAGARTNNSNNNHQREQHRDIQITSDSHPRQGQASSSSQSSRTQQPSSQSSSNTNTPSVAVDVLQNTGRQPQQGSVSNTSEPPLPAVLQRHDHHQNNQALPDILNSHVLPPYTAIRPNQHRPTRSHNNTNTTSNHGQRDRQTRSQGGGNNSQSRSRHPSNSSPTGTTTTTTDLPAELKECCSTDCCVQCVTVATTFRWVLVSLALLGVCCVVTGIILGALHMTVGEKFLTLSLMFIGLGVLLVVVVGVGWRCTPAGHEPCHVLFNLGEHRRPSTRPRTTRQPRRDRGGWYGGMLYPEFRNRRPPPSYAASMQDHPVQDEHQSNSGGGGQIDNQPSNNTDNYSLPSSPPPTYRSQSSTVRPGIHITFPPTQGGVYPSSRPPTYRSSAGDPRPSINMMSGEEPAQPGSVGQRAIQQEDIEVGLEENIINNSEDSDMIGITRAPTTVAIDPDCHSTIISVTTEEGTQRGDSEVDTGMMTPGNEGTTTLHRQQEVVQYLEGVLDDQIRKLSETGAEEDLADFDGVLVDELWYESERRENRIKTEDLGKLEQPLSCDTSVEGKTGETLENPLSHPESCDGLDHMAHLSSHGLSRDADRCTEVDINSEDNNESPTVTVNSYIATVQVKSHLPFSSDDIETTPTTNSKESHDNCMKATEGLRGDTRSDESSARHIDTSCSSETEESQVDRAVSMRDKDIQSCVAVRTMETQTSESSDEDTDGPAPDTVL